MCTHATISVHTCIYNMFKQMSCRRTSPKFFARRGWLSWAIATWMRALAVAGLVG